ncbi:MAG: hypothetical protein HY040_11000 [Planctomycetes bacterium]|nr:hypothetical protein [Planctomycetota bacterium]
MKVIDLKNKKRSLAEVLELASKENLVLKTAAGKEFVLAETDEFDREIALVRENSALMKLLEQRSKEKGKYSIRQVKQILKLI